MDLEYDSRPKHQSFEWKSLTSTRSKEVRRTNSKIKVMSIAFFNVRDIAHSEFLDTGPDHQSALSRELSATLDAIGERKEREDNFIKKSRPFTTTMLQRTMP